MRGIQFTYGILDGTYHGADSDDLVEEVCNINPGENILRVHGSTQQYRDELRSSEWIQRIEFNTNTGQICGPYGGEVGPKTFDSSFNDCNLYYISGTVMETGTISSITFHWKCDNSTTVSVF